jgi:hypothetical protein
MYWCKKFTDDYSVIKNPPISISPIPTISLVRKRKIKEGKRRENSV